MSILYGFTVKRNAGGDGFGVNPLHDVSCALHAGEHFAGKVLHTGEKVAEDVPRVWITSSWWMLLVPRTVPTPSYSASWIRRTGKITRSTWLRFRIN